MLKGNGEARTSSRTRVGCWSANCATTAWCRTQVYGCRGRRAEGSYLGGLAISCYEAAARKLGGLAISCYHIS